MRWLTRLTTFAKPGTASSIVGFHALVSNGFLTPAKASDTGKSGDWEDEIHPSNAGYKKNCRVASKPSITQRVGSRCAGLTAELTVY